MKSYLTQPFNISAKVGIEEVATTLLNELFDDLLKG